MPQTQLKFLADYLNKHKMLLRFICILPTLIAISFTYFYSLDVLNNFKVLTYNDEIATTSKYLYEISDAETIDNDTIKVTTTPTYTYTINNEDNSLLNICMYQGDILYMVANDEIISQHRLSSNLIDGFIHNEDNTYNVVLGDKNFTEIQVKENETFLNVSANDNGTYTIKNLLNNTTFDVDFVEGLYFEKGKYILTNGYIRNVNTLKDTYPCTALETDKVYIDVESNQLLQNISKYYVWEFFLQTKIYFVVLMLIVIIILFEIITKYKKLEINIELNQYKLSNIITLVLLLIVGFMSYLLLAVI